MVELYNIDVKMKQKKIIGILYKLDDDERGIIMDGIPARIEIERKKFFILNESIMKQLFETNAKINEVYAIPYLTTKRLIILLLTITKEMGLLEKWWALPLEYIKGVNFGKKRKGGTIRIKYRVPEIDKSLIRKIFGFKRKLNEFFIVFHTTNIMVWKTNLTKVVLDRKRKVLVPKLNKLKKEKKRLMKSKHPDEKKINELEKSIKKIEKEINELEEIEI